MTELISMRPGVTADYAPLPDAPAQTGCRMAVIGPAPALPPPGVPAVERFFTCDAAEALFPDSPLLVLIRAAFENQAGGVLAVRIGENDWEQAKAALRLLFSLEEPDCIAAGFLPGLAEYAASLLNAGEVKGGKLCFFAAGDGLAGGDPAGEAERVNCERILLTAPAVCPEGSDTDAAPALLAAMTARQETPTANLFGEEALGNYHIAAPLTEPELNELLFRGVTVFEPGALCPEVVRCVTTRTRDSGGRPDYRLRNLSATRTVDYVTQTLRAALDQKLEAGGLTFSAIAALAEWELLKLNEEGIISAYEKPRTASDPLDPSVCELSAGFTIRQSAAQVFLHLRYRA